MQDATASGDSEDGKSSPSWKNPAKHSAAATQRVNLAGFSVVSQYVLSLSRIGGVIGSLIRFEGVSFDDHTHWIPLESAVGSVVMR